MYTFSSSTLMTSNESRKYTSAMCWYYINHVMQFSDIAVSERLAFENSSFYLRPQGTALVISSSEIWRRSKGHWHFFRNFNQKSKMSSKQTHTHAFNQSTPMGPHPSLSQHQVVHKHDLTKALQCFPQTCFSLFVLVLLAFFPTVNRIQINLFIF